METKRNICLIDDDEIYHFLCKKTLELTHKVHNFMVFSNGREAIKFLSSHHDDTNNLPDVIFLDLNMPIMDGWQFLEEYLHIRSTIDKKMVIYIVTSSEHPEDLARANKIKDINGYIIKPITAKDFETIIDTFNGI